MDEKSVENSIAEPIETGNQEQEIDQEIEQEF